MNLNLDVVPINAKKQKQTIFSRNSNFAYLSSFV